MVSVPSQPSVDQSVTCARPVAAMRNNNETNNTQWMIDLYFIYFHLLIAFYHELLPQYILHIIIVASVCILFWWIRICLGVYLSDVSGFRTRLCFRYLRR